MITSQLINLSIDKIADMPNEQLVKSIEQIKSYIVDKSKACQTLAQNISTDQRTLEDIQKDRNEAIIALETYESHLEFLGLKTVKLC